MKVVFDLKEMKRRRDSETSSGPKSDNKKSLFQLTEQKSYEQEENQQTLKCENISDDSDCNEAQNKVKDVTLFDSGLICKECAALQEDCPNCEDPITYMYNDKLRYQDRHKTPLEKEYNIGRLDDLDKQELKLYKKAFDMFDVGAEGNVDVVGICLVLEMVGIEMDSEYQLEDIINSFDRVGNGRVDFPTFVQMINAKMQDMATESPLKNYKKIFSLLDSDHTGFLTIKNFKHAMKESGVEFDDSEIRELISAMDTDFDGKLGLEEFIRFQTKAYNRANTFGLSSGLMDRVGRVHDETN